MGEGLYLELSGLHMSESGTRITYPEASVHGRFQPFHNGHLEYVSEALALSDYLWVGITQVYGERLLEVKGAPSHRSARADNPYTFFDRVKMIRRSLLESGISASRFSVIPFPIEQPDYLQEFLPID